MIGAAGIFGNKPIDPLDIPTPGNQRRLVRPVAKVWPSKLNEIIIVSIIFLAPIPAASNQPIAWLFWALVLGITGFATVAFPRNGAGVGNHANTLLLLGSVYIGFAVFQAIPLPKLQGGISIQLPSGPVTLSSLSITSSATFLAALRTTSYLIFFWLVLRAAHNPRRAKRLGYVLFYSVTIHAFFALLALNLFGDINFVAEKTAYPGKATGTFVNKNSFATFLGMGLVLGLALSLNSKSYSKWGKIRQNFRYSCLIIILVTLLLTQSRMGIFASAGALTLVAARLRLAVRPRPKLWVVLVSAAIGIALTGLLAMLSDVSSSAATRAALYEQVIQLILSRPVTGWGLGSFPLAFELFHAPGVTAGFVWNKAHSTYLTLWAEAGIIAGSIPLIAGLLAARTLWRRSNTALPGQSVALAGFAVIVLGAIHSLVDFSLEIQANTFLFLAIIALGLGARQNTKGST